MRLELHATAIVVGEHGVLIRGPSGSGKSALAFALIDEARARGRYGALVADDRVFLEAANGALIARGAAGFEGLIENRGEGVLRLPHEPEVLADLLVDLGPQGSGPPRYPEEGAEWASFLEVTIPRLALDMAPGVGHAARATLRRLGIAPR